MLFQDILSLAKRHLFFSPIFCENSKRIISYCFGPAGSLLRENIKGEWIYSNVINRDLSVFLFTKQNLSEQLDNDLFTSVGEMCSNKFPFGIAKIYDYKILNLNNSNTTESSYFPSESTTNLSSETFCTPFDGMQYFFHWQRQRKLWWKKVSASPSRFFLGEIYKSSDKKVVNIIANFPWGNEIMETISICETEKNEMNDLKGNSIKPVIIKNEMSLDAAVIGLFCDALDDDSVHKIPVLRLHRKLTPYKCTFATSSSDLTTVEELNQLSFYLTKQFRKAGISTLLLPETSISILEQFQRNDRWGIPFTIILDSTSLITGVTNIRSRDTTLKEEVHVSELTSYIFQLIKNF